MVPDPVGELFEATPEAARCPYPAYQLMRAGEGPRWIERIQAFAVTRYADIIEVLRAPERFSSAMASGPGSVTPLARRLVEDPEVSPALRAKAQRRIDLSASPVLLFTDPPAHVRQRKLVNKAFTTRRVAAMEPAVEAIAKDLIGSFLDAGRTEMVSQFSMPLPMTVIADILGIPQELHATFKRWSDAFVAGTGNFNLSFSQIADMFTAVDEFYDYFTEQIARRRAEPTDDLLSAIVHARIGGETPLTQDEMLQLLVQFLVAGNETTTTLLTSVMFTLITTPELMAGVRAQRGLLPAVIEEVLRTQAPVQGVFRTATEDVTLGGVAIPAGANLYLVYGSANRDEHVFDHPEVLLPDRKAPHNHLAFGQGEHFCLGAALARLETRVGIDAWLDHTSTITLAGDPADVEYLPSFMLHSIARLDLHFTA